MHRIKLLLTGLATASISMAAIRGTVLNTSGIAIPGALVQLENGGQSVTTDVNGNFTINTSTAVNRISHPLVHNFCKIQKDLLSVTVEKRGVAKITAYDLSGKAQSSIQQTIEKGTNSLILPHMGTGIYLYRVRADGNEILLKGNSIGGSSKYELQGSSSSSTETNPAKQAKAPASVQNRVISATKNRYLNYRSIIFDSDTSELAIVMITSAGTITDADGNVYQTVRIGNQIWTVENLRTTKYNDGTAIPKLPDSTPWKNLTTPTFCFYNNSTDSTIIKKHGAFYNWYVVNPTNPKKIAPTGWHVPTDSEWTVMIKYLVLNGYSTDGTRDTTPVWDEYGGDGLGDKIAKSLSAKTNLIILNPDSTFDNLSKSNTTGFSALAVGLRGGTGFFSENYISFWWSTTVTENEGCCAWSREFVRALNFDSDLDSDLNHLKRVGCEKDLGFSIRLIKDN